MWGITFLFLSWVFSYLNLLELGDKLLRILDLSFPVLCLLYYAPFYLYFFVRMLRQDAGIRPILGFVFSCLFGTFFYAIGLLLVFSQFTLGGIGS